MNAIISADPMELPDFANNQANLADSTLGAAILAVSDEFFAPAERMIHPDIPIFQPGVYDDNGKWMDGWETRRRRDCGQDWCIIRLAFPGYLNAVDLDTSFFTGNFAPAASLQACYCPEGDPSANTTWHDLLEPVDLKGNSHHFHRIKTAGPWSHLRLVLYPDGGVARLRVYGRAYCQWESKSADEEYDLAAVANGGRQIACSNAHFGEPQRLLRPGRGINMGDGWETRRRREPGNDWCIIELGYPGIIHRVMVDTAHFKGNFPSSCSIQGALIERTTDKALISQSMFWETLLPQQPLRADEQHHFQIDPKTNAVSHVRFNIFPDGGISRLRLWGKPEK